MQFAAIKVGPSRKMPVSAFFKLLLRKTNEFTKMPPGFICFEDGVFYNEECAILFIRCDFGEWPKLKKFYSGEEELVLNAFDNGDGTILNEDKSGFSEESLNEIIQGKEIPLEMNGKIASPFKMSRQLR